MRDIETEKAAWKAFAVREAVLALIAEVETLSPGAKDRILTRIHSARDRAGERDESAGVEALNAFIFEANDRARR